VTVPQHSVEAGPPSEGVEGNARLTSATGLVLLVMLAVEGYTILNVRGLITLHIFLGILLVGPVLLKTASTTYRFARYYLGDEEYVRKGPPHVVLRVIGPLVTVSTLAVLGTGIGLIWNRTSGLLLTAHQASFIVWVGLMTIHVLGHVRGALLESGRELRRRSPGQRVRLAVVGVSLVVGVGTALVLFPHASSWTSGQLHHRDFVRAQVQQ
jgi:hypothetical protein